MLFVAATGGRPHGEEQTQSRSEDGSETGKRKCSATSLRTSSPTAKRNRKRWGTCRGHQGEGRGARHSIAGQLSATSGDTAEARLQAKRRE